MRPPPRCRRAACRRGQWAILSPSTGHSSMHGCHKHTGPHVAPATKTSVAATFTYREACRRDRPPLPPPCQPPTGARITTWTPNTCSMGNPQPTHSSGRKQPQLQPQLPPQLQPQQPQPQPGTIRASRKDEMPPQLPQPHERQQEGVKPGTQAGTAGRGDRRPSRIHTVDPSK